MLKASGKLDVTYLPSGKIETMKDSKKRKKC